MQNKDVFITEHAYYRARERLSLKKESLDRLAKCAYFDGIKHSDTTGSLNRYITKQYMKRRKANNVRIHGEVVFLFDNNKLITLYQLPLKLRKIANNIVIGEVKKKKQ